MTNPNSRPNRTSIRRETGFCLGIEVFSYRSPHGTRIDDQDQLRGRDLEACPIVDRMATLLEHQLVLPAKHALGILYPTNSDKRERRSRSRRWRSAALGAGSKARRRLEPPLCRPLARRRAANRHLHYNLTQRAWSPRALEPLPDAVSTSTGRTVQLSGQVITHKNHGGLDSVGLRPPRDSEYGCAGQLLLSQSSWMSEFLSEFLTVMTPMAPPDRKSLA